MSRERIAVVGSGIAGLSAAWLLCSRYDVTLFEAEGRLGGHTNSVDVTLGGVTAPVDTGFLVFNDRTYPNLAALFRHLGVQDAQSDMSFSVRIEEEDLEWSGSSLATVFAQKRNLANIEFWRMLQDILRFNRESAALLAAQGGHDTTLGEFLEMGGYGRGFRDWYLLPMGSAIWSCPTRRMLEYPAATFLRFCHNHGLLQIAGRPKWRTVLGGGREYVRRMAARIGDVRLSTPVREISRRPGAVRVVSDLAEDFAHVVLGCHSDQALDLLADATGAERDILSRIAYQANRAVLHTDLSLLPRHRDAWSAWNYMAGSGAADCRPVSVSYYINRLQPLPFRQPVIVTLNPVREPDPGTVIGTFEYAHPVFDCAATDAQRGLPCIQGAKRTWFCGAWTGYGFHEDGLKSALSVAGTLGVAAPWHGEAIAA